LFCHVWCSFLTPVLLMGCMAGNQCCVWEVGLWGYSGLFPRMLGLLASLLACKFASTCVQARLIRNAWSPGCMSISDQHSNFKQASEAGFPWLTVSAVLQVGDWDPHPHISKQYVPKADVPDDMNQPLSHYFISSGHNRCVNLGGHSCTQVPPFKKAQFSIFQRCQLPFTATSSMRPTLAHGNDSKPTLVIAASRFCCLCVTCMRATCLCLCLPESAMYMIVMICAPTF